jgi:hypothetical protein
MQTIDKTEAKQLIEDSKGLIFAATFTKKDGTNRLMNARLGKQYTSKTGKKAPYDPEQYNLLPVYDMKLKGFRMLNLNTLLSLSINNNKYIIE